MDEKLALLAKVPLFAGLGPKDIEHIGRLAEEVTVQPGKVLTREGEAGEEFFVIIDGTIAISRDGQKIRDLGAGDFLGELALLGNVPRSATATAATEATLLVLGHREFRTMMTDHPPIQSKILKGVATWIATLTPDRSC